MLVVVPMFSFPASEAKCLKRGVKEVVKSIRRGNKGLGLNISSSLACTFSTF